MARYAWPGNVRELQNLVERLIVLKGEGEVRATDLPDEVKRGEPLADGAARVSLARGGLDLRAVMEQLEDRLIGEALDLSGGNKTQAADLLGLKRTTLIEKLRRRRTREE